MKDERQETFDAVRALMARHAPPLTVTSDTSTRYDLTSVVDVEIDGRRKSEVHFAGLIIQKSYVGFYFMPVYADRSIADVLAPALVKLLKGKSCFHLKRLDEEMAGHVAAALERGFALYGERGWLPA